MKQLKLASTTAEDIRLLLNLLPQFLLDFEEARLELASEQSLIFSDPSFGFSWCNLYEIPILEHIATLKMDSIVGHDVSSAFGELSNANDQIGAIPTVINNVDERFAAKKTLSQDEAISMMPEVGAMFGIALSLSYSLKCVLYFGCFINDLIEKVRMGDDNALFNAVKMDATVIGCPSAIKRISKASFLDDQDFFKKLKLAICGKVSSREQKNFQKMRLVFEILYEVGAEKLTDDQLHELFVTELNLYSWDAKEGGNAKALRKFADTYMKENATT